MDNNINRAIGCESQMRQPASQEIMGQVAALEKRAEALALRVSEKLRPVIIDRPEEDRASGSPCREFPPLFSDLREHLFGIDRYLSNIERDLYNTEL